MLYTRIQNKRIWADMFFAYNLVRKVLKLSELHCNGARHKRNQRILNFEVVVW